MQLSIIIVNYKTYALTKQTIEAVLATTRDITYEIILVDNASCDGSIEKLKKDFLKERKEGRIRILQNSVNAGFSKANNIGIKASKGNYILLLNSDTEVYPYCINDALRQIKRDPTIGALGCKVILPDGKLDHACKRGFPTPSASLYYLLGLDKKNPEKYGQYDALTLGEDEIGEVDVLMGAFMLMPRRVLRKVGLLDTRFFMYGEDIDLCYRIKAAGYKVLYYPVAKMTHHKGGSSKRRRLKVIYDFHHAMWLFYKKHYRNVYPFYVTLLVYIGICLKCLLAWIKGN